MRYLVTLVLAAALLGCAPSTDSGSEGVPVDEEVARKQSAMDRQSLRALENAGSDLSKPHMLEHHFICEDPAKADPVVSWAAGAGYAATPVTPQEFEGRKYVSFDLVKAVVPTIENVTRESTRMLRVAAKHGVEYDGWGSSLVK